MEQPGRSDLATGLRASWICRSDNAGGIDEAFALQTKSLYTMAMEKAVTVEFNAYGDSIRRALDAIGAREVIRQQRAILLKPNLVTADSHPVTTHPDCCAAVIDYIRSCSDAAIVVAGFDPLAVDREAARLLRRNWQDIPHLF